MRYVPWGVGLLAAWCLFLGQPGLSRAVDQKSGDTKTLDQTISDTLREVINRGADLYNGGDQNGCYRLYEGALMAIRPLLTDHKDWQKDIDNALAEAGRNPEASQRAFVLRGEMDKIRKAVKESGGATSKPPEKGKATTHWDRLGGEAGVRKIVDDFVDLAGKDPAVDFFRGGKYKNTDLKPMKQTFVEFISAASGGPLPYKGKDLKSVHKGMGVTDAQFDACALDLRKALKMNNVKEEDITSLLTVVGLTRADIVETPEKKPK